jgi:hypothetical protein
MKLPRQHREEIVRTAIAIREMRAEDKRLGGYRAAAKVAMFVGGLFYIAGFFDPAERGGSGRFLAFAAALGGFIFWIFDRNDRSEPVRRLDRWRELEARGRRMGIEYLHDGKNAAVVNEIGKVSKFYDVLGDTSYE